MIKKNVIKEDLYLRFLDFLIAYIFCTWGLFCYSPLYLKCIVKWSVTSCYYAFTSPDKIEYHGQRFDQNLNGIRLNSISVVINFTIAWSVKQQFLSTPHYRARRLILVMLLRLGGPERLMCWNIGENYNFQRFRFILLWKDYRYYKGKRKRAHAHTCTVWA